ncbi:MAG: rhodanese-like domain-containing protein [Thiobacillus sp.]|nr:rhodanese-like domain-containing protein [Thiobacillus sp.]
MNRPVLHMGRRLGALCLLAVLAPGAPRAEDAAGREVRITHELSSVTVLHRGKPVVIERNPDTENTIEPDFALTSRPCPPFCVLPMTLAPGVETLGELELIGYLQQVGKNSGVLVIDSRDGSWPQRSGVIPGAVLLPWQKLHPAHASAAEIADTLQFQFGAARQDGLWNFAGAKTLVFYCNGPWCGQSPTNIRQLLALGYPAHKLKWYRGGIQDWKALGLTTVPYDNTP